MPDPHSTLSIFAEVSIALVGFSGIVIAFGRRSQGALTPLEVRRLSNLFACAGGVLMMSIINLSLLHTSVDRGLFWSINSGVVLVLGSTWLLYDWVRIGRLDAGEREQVSRYILYPFNATAVLLLLLQGLNSAIWLQSWPYFLALGYAIAFALQQFILLVRMGLR